MQKDNQPRRPTRDNPRAAANGNATATKLTTRPGQDAKGKLTYWLFGSPTWARTRDLRINRPIPDTREHDITLRNARKHTAKTRGSAIHDA